MRKTVLRPARSIALLSITMFLAACAGLDSTGLPEPTAAEQEALTSLVSLQDRLDRVAAPLLVNNPELCKDSARKLFGFTAKNMYSYSDELASAAHQALGLDERLQVVRVLAGSGAARVGVRKGDSLIAVEDQPLPQGRKAGPQAAAIIGPLVAGKSNVKLTVMRDNANVVLDVPLTLACAFSVELGNADNTNAYADGQRVAITRGMMQFAQTDNELAYVIAKEMAHNVLGHPSSLRISGTMSEMIDNLVLAHPDMSAMNGMAGLRPFPAELDVAADTWSLYMVARAGYSVDGATRFWQRLARQFPASVMNGYTAIHPATVHRLSAMEKILPDVKRKQAVQNR